MSDEIKYADAREITFLIHRERNEKEFRLFKKAVQERRAKTGVGILQPLHVRNIEHWPKEKRRRPDGGLSKWQALFGEGRCRIAIESAKELKDPTWYQVPIQIKDVPEAQIPGIFMGENELRKGYTWQEQARLMRDLVGDGDSPEKVAKAFHITVGHAAKLLRIIRAASPQAVKELDKFTVQQSEALTSLPATGQEIVLEEMKEQKLEPWNVVAVVRKAKEISETQELSKTALRQSMKRLDEDLKEVREALKPIRLHFALGPQNVDLLLADKAFRSALDKRKINYSSYQQFVGSIG